MYFLRVRRASSLEICVFITCICVLFQTQIASAARNVIGIDAFRLHNQANWSNNVWGTVTVANTAYDYITVSMADQSPSSGGAYFGMQDVNFDPNAYELEVIYRPGTGNLANSFRIEARQNDGVDTNGLTMGENYAWDFPDFVNEYNAGTPDADGFLRVTRDVTAWDGQGGPAYGYDLTGDASTDFDVFENGVPNTLTEMQVQSGDDGSGALPGLELDIKSVRFVPKTPLPYVAIIDNTGISGTWGTGGGPGAYSRDDGTQFTNIVLDLQAGTGGQVAGDNSGGLYVFKAPDATTFDGNTHSIELTAKLLPNNAATQIVVEMLDLDGHSPNNATTDALAEKIDGAANQIQLIFNTADFNSTGMTTVSLPISSVLDNTNGSFIGTQVWNVDNPGDGLIDEISVYQMAINSLWQSAERLNIEIESVKIVSDSASVACDFDADGDCDPTDIDLLYGNWGAVGGAFDVDASGMVDAGDIGAWLIQASSATNPFNSAGKTFLIGDVDFDGDIDSSDLGILLNRFNDDTGLLYQSGNLNDDAFVNSSDLGLLLNGFGATSAAAAAVPEPDGLSLLLVLSGLVAGVLRRRRR